MNAPSVSAHRPWNARTAPWKEQVRSRLVDVDSIVQFFEGRLRLRADALEGMRRAAAAYPVATTPYYLSLADPEDPRDPILAQVLPDPAEAAEGGEPDPFQELELEIAPGVVHRYPDRALFLLTNYCSTLCRHCMRKREWGRRFSRLTDDQVEVGVAAIAARPQIRDVLLSGGDPLNLAPAFVGRVLAQLRSRCRLDVVRFGSRVPVTLPMRLDDAWIAALEPHTPLFLNTHFNHAREVSAEAGAAVRRLQRAGVVVSNQAVLLRGVNDDETALLELSFALLRVGVRAYYLHHCDPVQGARHMRVGLRRGRELVRRMRGRVTGLGMPRFVVDLPGGGGKVDADGSSLLRVEDDVHVYRSPLHGKEVRVDGSEGSFKGLASWLVPTESASLASRPR